MNREDTLGFEFNLLGIGISPSENNKVQTLL